MLAPVDVDCRECAAAVRIPEGRSAARCPECQAWARRRREAGAGTALVARRVAWCLFLAWAMLLLVLHAVAFSSQREAVQQAAVAGDSCAWMLGGYFVVRAVDGLAASFSNRT